MSDFNILKHIPIYQTNESKHIIVSWIAILKTFGKKDDSIMEPKKSLYILRSFSATQEIFI